MKTMTTNLPSPHGENKRFQKGRVSDRLKKLFAFFPYEAKRVYSKKLLIIWIIILLLKLFFTYIGINEHLKREETVKKFKEIQRAMFSKILNYDTYSLMGINYFFAPSPNNIFARNSAIPPDMTASVDSNFKVHIDNNMKGKALIINLFFGQLDFCLILLLLMTIFAQYYGFDSFHTPRYLKFLSSLTSHRFTVVSVLVARFLLLAGGVILMFAGSLGLCLLRGVTFSGTDIISLLAILGAGLVMLLFFFAIGSWIGTLKKTGNQILAFSLTWFLVAILALYLFVTLHEYRFNDSLDDYKTELAKFEEVTNFEKELIKKYKGFTEEKRNIYREETEKYWRTTFKRIKSKETKLKTTLSETISNIDTTAILVPTVFFMHTCNEASSCGYSNFLLFYDYAITQQEAFTRFWIDRVYYHNPKEIVSFIKSEEDVFRARSRVPRFFWLSLAISLFYCALLFYITYHRLKRAFLPVPSGTENFAGVSLEMKAGRKHLFYSKFPEFNRQLINVFLGSPRVFDWLVSLDGKSMLIRVRRNILYLPGPALFPGDITASDMFNLIRRLVMRNGEPAPWPAGEIDRKDLRRPFQSLTGKTQTHILLLLTQWLDRPFVIFEDFIPTLPEDERVELSAIADKMNAGGATLIDLSSTDTTWLGSDINYRVSRKSSGEYVIS